MQRFLACFTLMAAAGCHWDLNDAGTEPLPAQLYFPSGLAVDTFTDTDGAHPYLFVSNANADLHYGGGTVQMVDLARFDQALKSFPTCEGQASCANADVGLCKRDPIDPQVIDCDETPFILGDATVKVGNFAGSMTLQTFPQDATHRRLYVGVRGDPSITWIDVDYTKRSNPLGMLNCFDDPSTLTSRPGFDSTTMHDVAPPACDGSHLIQTFDELPTGGSTVVNNCVTGMMQTTNGDCTIDLPPEPFGLFLDEGTDYARLLVSHLSSGQVTLIDASATPPPILSVSQPFFAADPNGRHGAFALAPQFPGTAHSLWYMTSNIQSVLATFRVADANVVVPAGTISVSGVFNGGNDVREILFAPDGSRAFLTQNQPPTVAVLDTRVTPTSGGLPVNQIVDVIDVCQEPSNMLMQRLSGPGPIGAAAQQLTRLFVVCFLSNQVMIVDPDTADVLGTVLLGRGPSEIAYQETAGFSPERRAYVTNFGDWTISMIDLDPGSPTENRVVARIGLPTPPPNP